MVSKRSIGKKLVSFGLLNIPVKIVTMREDKQVHFHNVRKSDGSRIKMQKVAEADGKPVFADDLALGYENKDGTVTIFDKAEIDAVKPESDKKIKIEGFTDLTTADKMFLDSAYILVPDDGGAEAYSLLLKVFETNGKAGIARVTMRQKEYTVLIHAYKGGLVMSTLKYVDEVVTPAELDELKSLPPVEGQMLNMAQSIVDSLGATFDMTKYKDTARENLEALIAAKRDGKTVTVEKPKKEKPTGDLMAQLQATLAATKAQAQ